MVVPPLLIICESGKMKITVCSGGGECDFLQFRAILRCYPYSNEQYVAETRVYGLMVHFTLFLKIYILLRFFILQCGRHWLFHLKLLYLKLFSISRTGKENKLFFLSCLRLLFKVKSVILPQIGVSPSQHLVGYLQRYSSFSFGTEQQSVQTVPRDK